MRNSLFLSFCLPIRFFFFTRILPFLCTHQVQSQTSTSALWVLFFLAWYRKGGEAKLTSNQSRNISLLSTFTETSLHLRKDSTPEKDPSVSRSWNPPFGGFVFVRVSTIIGDSDFRAERDRREREEKRESALCEGSPKERNAYCEFSDCPSSP